jgi:hypothetical protein
MGWGGSKIQGFKFDSISLTDESPVDKENSIGGRKVQNQMFMDSIKFNWKFNWIYIGFNWEKLKLWGQIIIFESCFDQLVDLIE